MTTPHMPTVDSTLGDLVTHRPGWSRIFESLGIDYCCGGKLPLKQACADRGLDARTVLAMLQASPDHDQDASAQDRTNWSDLSLTELADHIEQTHHAYLKQELPRLEAMVRKVAAVHGDRHPWMVEVREVYARFAADMHSHMMKEEHGLFPLIRNLEGGDGIGGADGNQGMANPISLMEHEHDDAGRDLTAMRELTSGYTAPADACNTFRAMLDGLRQIEADTHRHVHKENSILFPAALQLEQRLANV